MNAENTMDVVIAGGGSVGRFIAEQLVAGGHRVLIIESEASVVGQYEGTIEGVRWLKGDGCDFGTLKAAGLERADVIASVTGDDEDNLVISLLAKQEFAVPRVIARVNNPKNHWLFDETWGVDVAVSTPHLLTALVEEAVSVGSLVRLLNLDGGARLVELTLAADSPAVGKSLAQLGVPRDASIVAVVRARHVIVPHGDTTLAAGDEVIALVTGEVEDQLARLLAV